MNTASEDAGRRAARGVAAPTNTVDLRTVGSINLLDFDIIFRFRGRDFLPFPFMFTQPARFSRHDEYVEHEKTVPDRFNNGDLAVFQQCFGAYDGADIRVECHVQYIPADTPSVRVVAYRLDQAGFLAQQRPDDDVIDIYELCPYLLGPAVADSVSLTTPGRRSAIIVPEYVRGSNNSNNVGASEDVTIRHTIEGAGNATKVPRGEVTAFGTVQTQWRPTRHWGIDPGKTYAVWVRIKNDGEYLYKPDFGEATPMTRPMLAERIDRLISEDVKALRQFRDA